MRKNDPPAANPGALIDAVLKSAAEGHITLESGIRLIFIIRRAGDKGYAWWKRTRLAEHWGVHPNTITRDYEQWTELGFTKLRPNPFKASAKLVIFAWSKVWDDSVWNQPEKVASMLPDLRDAFGQNGHEGRIHATQKGRTDATCSMDSTIDENLKVENVKQQQAAAGGHAIGNFSAQIPRKPPSDHRSEGAPPLGSAPNSAGIREKAVEGFSDMQALLAKYHVRVQPGQIQNLIEAGRAQGLTLDGAIAFVEDKLMQKRDQNDPVFSAKLLITAISDYADLHRWVVKRHRSSSFFEQTATRVEAPFSVAELRGHLSVGAQRLRAITGYDEIAAELDLLAASAEAHLRDLDALEHRLIDLEKTMNAIAQSSQSEAVITEIRKAVNSQLDSYRERMSQDQLAMLEQQCFERNLFDYLGLPRLSLFYLCGSSRAAA